MVGNIGCLKKNIIYFPLVVVIMMTINGRYPMFSIRLSCVSIICVVFFILPLRNTIFTELH